MGETRLDEVAHEYRHRMPAMHGLVDELLAHAARGAEDEKLHC